jgi:hypothetical protein
MGLRNVNVVVTGGSRGRGQAHLADVGPDILALNAVDASLRFTCRQQTMDAVGLS